MWNPPVRSTTEFIIASYYVFLQLTRVPTTVHNYAIKHDYIITEQEDTLARSTTRMLTF